MQTVLRAQLSLSVWNGEKAKAETGLWFKAALALAAKLARCWAELGKQNQRRVFIIFFFSIKSYFVCLNR